MTPQFGGRWTLTVLDTGDGLQDVGVDVRDESIAVHLAGTIRTHRFTVDNAVADWCLVMRTTRIALWTSALTRLIPFKELLDPAWSSPLARVDLQLHREGLRWRARHGQSHTTHTRSALHALLLSPRLMIHDAAILEHAPVLWPVPASPSGGTDNVDCATMSRIVDILVVTSCHVVALHLDLLRLTLTPAGGEGRQFASMLELLNEAIRLRKTVEWDPCVGSPPPPERDAVPHDIGGEHWIAVPELGILAQLPVYNGRYWACNWEDCTGEYQCSSAATPLLMVNAMLRRAEEGIRMRHGSEPD